jgi:hypothetical protein
MSKSPSVLSFAVPKALHLTDRAQFLDAVAAAQAGYDLVDAAEVDGMDVDGNLSGVEARLSARAFTDICALTQTPEAYVRRIAKRNEALAMDLMRDALNNGMLRGCVLLVDTESQRVDGVVVEDKHNAPDAKELFRLAMSAAKDTRMMGGWIAGTSFRMTATIGAPLDVKSGKAAMVGDLMGTGFEIVSDVGSLACTSITDYAERLSCLNGMLARDQQHSCARKHAQFDLDDELLTTFVATIERAKLIHALARRAANHFFDGDGVKDVLKRISHGTHPAAGQKLCDHAKKQAVAEAQRDCRKAGEICLWDFVNGVTDAAKHAGSLDRRRDIEHLGYVLMSDVLES